jgi:hypothetical protein
MAIRPNGSPELRPIIFTAFLKAASSSQAPFGARPSTAAFESCVDGLDRPSAFAPVGTAAAAFPSPGPAPTGSWSAAAVLLELLEQG